MADAMTSSRPSRARPITLLLVDDEPAILKALQRVVRDEGYKVITALDAEEALRLVASESVDVVLSDMAPNMSGIAVSDQARSMELAELARDFALLHLKPEGVFLVKIFQGAGYDDYLLSLRRAFVKVLVRKPDASRDESAEQYLLARGLKDLKPAPAARI